MLLDLSTPRLTHFYHARVLTYLMSPLLHLPPASPQAASCALRLRESLEQGVLTHDEHSDVLQG